MHAIHSIRSNRWWKWGLVLCAMGVAVTFHIADARAQSSSDSTGDAAMRVDGDAVASNPERGELSKRQRRRLRTLLSEGRRAERGRAPDEALASYREAYRFFPHSAILLSLARTHRAAEHWRAARSAYEAFLQRRPDHAERERIESTLERMRARLSRRADPTEKSEEGEALKSQTTSPRPTMGREKKKEDGSVEKASGDTAEHRPPLFGVWGWSATGVSTLGVGLLGGAWWAERRRRQHVAVLRAVARTGKAARFERVERRVEHLQRISQGLLYGGIGLSLTGLTVMALDLFGGLGGDGSSSGPGLAVTSANRGVHLEWQMPF